MLNTVNGQDILVSVYGSSGGSLGQQKGGTTASSAQASIIGSDVPVGSTFQVCIGGVGFQAKCQWYTHTANSDETATIYEPPRAYNPLSGLEGQGFVSHMVPQPFPP